MGIHKQNQVQDYWQMDKRLPKHPMVYNAMCLNRFEQLQRFIHVSDPDKEGSAHTKVRLQLQILFCNKLANNIQVEPLSTHMLKQTTSYWNPGTDVAVDEAMTRFTGRSSDIVTIPNKPIATGFKIWVLAQMGYCL